MRQPTRFEFQALANIFKNVSQEKYGENFMKTIRCIDSLGKYKMRADDQA